MSQGEKTATSTTARENWFKSQPVVFCGSTSDQDAPWQPLLYVLSPRISLFRLLHINGITRQAALCAWLLPLGVEGWRLIPAAACVTAPFLLLADTPRSAETTLDLSSVGGHLGCFHLVFPADSVAMAMGPV